MKSPAEPKKIDRCYYRSITTGSRGVMLDDGKTIRVRLGSGKDLDHRYDERTWLPDGDERHPLTREHIGRICHAADAMLGKSVHEYARANRTWESLSRKERTAWKDVGPTEDPIRKSLWEAIQAWGEGVTRVDP